jgi:hypothetical protein
LFLVVVFVVEAVEVVVVEAGEEVEVALVLACPG